MKFSDILYDGEYFSKSKGIDRLTVKHITSDARDIQPGTVFFFLHGVSYDTTKLLPLIRAKAPAVIVSEEPLPENFDVCPQVTVPSARRALAFALSRMCGIDYNRMRFIGITGTNGKTTTATMLSAILETGGAPVGRIMTGRISVGKEELAPPFYSMTTPDPSTLYPAIRKMQDVGCRYVVMEVSSHALALEKVAPIPFSVAIFTNLSEEHLDFHGDMDSYFEAKKKLFFQSAEAVINTDDAYGDKLAREIVCPVTTVGAVSMADVTARSIDDGGIDGLSFLYHTDGLSFIQRLKISGIHNIYNAMLALTAALRLGISPKTAREAVASLGTVCGRMEKIAEKPTVYIDYAHTPEALKVALKLLNRSKKEGQKIILVFGCGGERDRGKRPHMAAIAETYADSVIVTSDNNRKEDPCDILRDILTGFTDRKKYKVISDREKAIRYAVDTMENGDILLVAGKGHETYTVDKDGYRPFDERKIISEALEEKIDGHT